MHQIQVLWIRIQFGSVFRTFVGPEISSRAIFSEGEKNCFKLFLHFSFKIYNITIDPDPGQNLGSRS